MTAPRLSDGTITLRGHTPEDAEPMYAAIRESMAQMAPWLPWCHPGYSIEDTREFITRAQAAWAAEKHYPFAIVDARDGTFLGGIGINHVIKANQLGNVGYWVRTSCAGRGVAVAAVRLTALFGFDALNFTRLEIVCIPDNRASRRVAEKAPAMFEGIARNRLVMHDRAYDAAVYSLIPGDVPGSLEKLR